MMTQFLKAGLFVGFLLISVFGFTQNRVLVWHDEFEVDGLPDSEKWDYDVGGGGWGNEELQYYTDYREENARVTDGNLVIEAHNEYYGGRDYTSARLITKYKGDWKYGRIEVKAKVPAGTGTWPAIWMLPTDWEYGDWPSSGEIDIMEYVGYDPDVIHQTIHTLSYNHINGTQQGNSTTVTTAEEEFHVYAIEWAEESIEFYIDDELSFTFNNLGTWQRWPFDKRFHLLLNIAIGGSWGGINGVDDTIFPVQMEVDYVRVYQEVDAVEISGEQYVNQQQEVSFEATYIGGASYSWTIPTDATILQGQGTNEISVLWGDNHGEVSVLMEYEDLSYTDVFEVVSVVVPAEDEFVLEDFDDSDYNNIADPDEDENIFTLMEQDSELRIDYSIADPDLMPKVVIDFEHPVNLSELEMMHARIKSNNESNTVRMRLDLVDVYGLQTSLEPVFYIFPESDGQYHTHSYYFADKWVSGDPSYGETVDNQKIAQAMLYINFGEDGVANAADSLWIDYLMMSKSEEGVAEMDTPENLHVYPNPAKEFVQLPLINGNYDLCILSSTGKQLIKQQQVSSNQMINLNDFAKGLYMLLLIDEEGRIAYQSKILKM